VDVIRLGHGGPLVSRLGLGTGYFGTRISLEGAERLVDGFLEGGGTLIDTADCYGRGVLRAGVGDAGASEELLGRVLTSRRERVVLASKVGQRVIAGAGSDKVGLSPVAISRAVEASLRRLRTDRIDLYQCHLFDPYTPVEDTLGTLTRLVDEGKIGAAGVSNWDGWQVLDANAVAARDGLTPVVSDQVWYNLADRRAENSVAPACRRAGAGVIAYSGLAGGFLSGSYTPSMPRPAAGSRLMAHGQLVHTSWEGLATPRGWRVVEAVVAAAKAFETTPSTVALRWLLDAGAADVVLGGPRNESELQEFLLAAEARLSQSALDQLTALSEPEYSYPRSFTEAYAHPGGPLYGGLPDLGYGSTH
jgi:aryl-alcohol dehydrogenase-like predicted oxidoreductase